MLKPKVAFSRLSEPPDGCGGIIGSSGSAHTPILKPFTALQWMFHGATKKIAWESVDLNYDMFNTHVLICKI